MRSDRSLGSIGPAGAWDNGWAAYHWRYGHRRPVQIGMLAGLWGLTVWSYGQNNRPLRTSGRPSLLAALKPD